MKRSSCWLIAAICCLGVAGSAQAEKLPYASSRLCLRPRKYLHKVESASAGKTYGRRAEAEGARLFCAIPAITTKSFRTSIRCSSSSARSRARLT